MQADQHVVFRHRQVRLDEIDLLLHRQRVGRRGVLGRIARRAAMGDELFGRPAWRTAPARSGPGAPRRGTRASAAKRNGERMMVVTVSELYRRAWQVWRTADRIAPRSSPSSWPCRRRDAGVDRAALSGRDRRPGARRSASCDGRCTAASPRLLVAVVGDASSPCGGGRQDDAGRRAAARRRRRSRCRSSRLRQASRVPRIHDITTDTEQPAAVRQRRSAARGRAESGRVRRAGDRRAATPGIS